jgi:tetratricopeptide (TPR) repeat protein
MMRTAFSILAFAAIFCAGLPSYAWGPKTQDSIVYTSVLIFSRDTTTLLRNLMPYIREGATVSPKEAEAFFFGYRTNPVAAIEREMNLLQAVRSDRIDPHYAFRLGALGQLVADTTAPMRTLNPVFRDRYFSDVDTHVARAKFEAQPRRIVDPRAYFRRLRGQVEIQENTIIREYQAGQGFDGLASAALSTDLSRSVSAVLDVWHTVLSRDVSSVNISTGNMQNYVLGSLAFYLGQGNMAEVLSAYDRIRALGMNSVGMRQKVGDMFFDAKVFDRAMEEYEEVLLLAPGNRELSEKMARYYEDVGIEALAQDNLEASRDALRLALDKNKLRPEIPRKLDEVNKLIIARDDRLAATREAIRLAKELETQANLESGVLRFAAAMGLLRQAEDQYALVTAEFAEEARVAASGRARIRTKTNAWHAKFLESAQTLSGSGTRDTARCLAAETPGLHEDAMRALLAAELNSALEQLTNDLAEDSFQND